MESKKQTCLEFMRTASAEEIAEVLGKGHPPVGEVHCDCTSCERCWLEWLQTGEPAKCHCGTIKEVPHE